MNANYVHTWIRGAAFTHDVRSPMTNDEQIAACILAYDKRNKRLDSLSAKYSPPDHCCASCASDEWRVLYAKQERAAIVLAAKLRRRNGVGDVDIIARLRSDYPTIGDVFPGVAP